jgi:hypothetical protein
MPAEEPQLTHDCRVTRLWGVGGLFNLMRQSRFVSTALLVFLFLSTAVRAGATICAVCEQPIYGGILYFVTDKVVREKKYLCESCVSLEDVCFACSLPVRPEAFSMSDGRFFCARDLKAAVVDPIEAEKIGAAVKNDLDRQLSRFTAFPDNLRLEVVDRINLLAFKVPGNDFACPNILGYFRSETNGGKVTYRISVLSGLMPGELRSTCAHEYAHAWVHANVPAERKNRLGQDAEEGFCELVSYLLMAAQRDEQEQLRIQQNQYTRGQISVFIEAERKYGFNDILDWMKYGVEPEFTLDNLGEVRSVTMPRLPGVTLTSVPAAPKEIGPRTLALKGLGVGGGKSWALINNQTFVVGESGKVRLGDTNVMVRCLAIGTDWVRIRVAGRDRDDELHLNRKLAAGDAP